MTDSPTADIPQDSRTAKDVIDTIAEGQFYEDYDQSTGDLGILRALLSERDQLRAQLQAARDEALVSGISAIAPTKIQSDDDYSVGWVDGRRSAVARLEDLRALKPTSAEGEG